MLQLKLTGNSQFKWFVFLFKFIIIYISLIYSSLAQWLVINLLSYVKSKTFASDKDTI